MDKRAVLTSRNKRRKVSLDNVSGSSGGVSKRMKITYSDSEPSDNENDFLSVQVHSKRNKSIVNIIDRVIDFSKYKEDTSLYSLCRDWTRATEKLNSDMDKSSMASETEKDSSETNQLPIPSEPPRDIGLEIAKLNETIQSKVRSSEDSDLDLIKVLNVDETTEVHALLKLHVNRWKSSRKEWLRYYETSNERYKETRDKLKSMFKGI